MLTEEQFENIAHTLGIDLNKGNEYQHLPEEYSRNLYSYGDKNSATPMWIQDLIRTGLVKDGLRFDSRYFIVTKLGIEEFEKEFYTRFKYIKPKKSEKKYREFLNADFGCDFNEYLGIKLPKLEWKTEGYGHDVYRYKSSKYQHVAGEWSNNKKEAKISYKLALKEYLKTTPINKRYKVFEY